MVTMRAAEAGHGVVAVVIRWKIPVPAGTCQAVKGRPNMAAADPGKEIVFPVVLKNIISYYNIFPSAALTIGHRFFCREDNMRQLVIDQLSREEWLNLENYCKRNLRPGPMEGLFWLELPPELWGSAQQGHEECAPFFFAVELPANKLVCELLVRSSANLHCSCIGYADPAQRNFLLDFFDRLLAEEKITA
jgi:hypothetical protein